MKKIAIVAVALGTALLLQAAGYYYPVRNVAACSSNSDSAASACDAAILRAIRCQVPDPCVRITVCDGFVMVYGPRDHARAAIHKAIEVQGVTGTDFIAQ